MKLILISIRPKWCEKISHEIGKDENGKLIYEKQIEVRKSKLREVPCRVLIYETKGATETPWADEDGHLIFRGRGQVIGEFICDEIDTIVYDCQFGYLDYLALCDTCLSIEEIQEYGKCKTLYGWHISDLKIYDKPRELSEFFRPCPTKEKGDCLRCDCLADNDYGGICTNNLTRPPQSFMYVEEL